MMTFSASLGCTIVFQKVEGSAELSLSDTSFNKRLPLQKITIIKEAMTRKYAFHRKEAELAKNLLNSPRFHPISLAILFETWLWTMMIPKLVEILHKLYRHNFKATIVYCWYNRLELDQFRALEFH